MDASVKTPGFLIDELITIRVKLNVMDVNEKRQSELETLGGEIVDAINKQLEHNSVGEAIQELINSDIDCFFAQERLFDCRDAGDKEGAGEAAIEVQELNANRNKWIRKIDAILGVGKYSPTEKTYG